MSAYAKVIADSITTAGDRLTTFEVRFHRFVLAEFNTHRVFSRNSASSRAIPVHKQIQRLYDDPAIPVSWPLEKQGMQGGDELDLATAANAEQVWVDARNEAILAAENLRAKGVHKSVTNRLLEPFMWHTVVVSATAWQNFLLQRVSPLAQPEIQAPARLMLDAYEESQPKTLTAGDWHLPYVDESEVRWDRCDVLRKVSAARCARVSYLTQDGVRDIEKDLELYDRLVSARPMHASPLEHVARPAPENQHWVKVPHYDSEDHEIGHKMLLLPRYGNFLGFHQHRFDVEAAIDYQAFQ